MAKAKKSCPIGKSFGCATKLDEPGMHSHLRAVHGLSSRKVRLEAMKGRSRPQQDPGPVAGFREGNKAADDPNLPDPTRP